MRIGLLHTSDVHVATFDNIFAQLDDSIQLTHEVRSDLLDRARNGGLGPVRDETEALLKDLAPNDAVICTCSTLGPIADDISRDHPNVFRIDRPLMEQACTDGAKILVAICLESTREATLALLHQCASGLKAQINPDVLLCNSAWPHFEAGDMTAFASEIVRSIKGTLVANPDYDCIVLAQASMRVAAPGLQDVPIPVRSSPELAARHAIAIGNQNR